LVAGGLILIFLWAAYLVRREGPRYPWMWKGMLAGIILLLVQAILGGVTVLLRLPTLVSTAHLGLAFLFLALVTVLAVASRPAVAMAQKIVPEVRGILKRGSLLAACLAFAQSLVGATVRHTDAGMACPDVPLCLGAFLPPLQNPMVALHFSHRLLGLGVVVSALWVGHVAFRRSNGTPLRTLGVSVGLVAGLQLLLGFLSVYYRLAVVPVSLHTLLAAVLLCLLAATATLAWTPEKGEGVS
jgi:heme A synthase